MGSPHLNTAVIIGKTDALYTPAHHPTKPTLASDSLLGKREVEYHTTRIVNIVTCALTQQQIVRRVTLPSNVP